MLIILILVLKKAKKLVLLLICDFISSVIENKAWYDYKSLLQTFLQRTYNSIPIYNIDRVEGPDHNHTFWVQVTAAGDVYGPSQGKSKKEAEQVVAKLAYEALCNR